MDYFDNIEFLAGGAIPGYRCEIDTVSRESFSFEFIRSGGMRCSIEYGQYAVIETPSAFWHMPGTRYKYGPLDERGWDHHWLLIRGKRAEGLISNALALTFPSGFAPVLDPDGFDTMYHELLAATQPPNAALHPKAVALLETMVAQLVVWSRRSLFKDDISRRLEGLMASMRSSPASVFDFEALSAKLGMSYANFRRLFKRISGKAPYEYLLDCRMRKAAVLLSEGDLQVKEIAWELGFRDPARLCKLFRAKIGVSPGQYREMTKTDDGRR